METLILGVLIYLIMGFGESDLLKSSHLIRYCFQINAVNYFFYFQFIVIFTMYKTMTCWT